MAESGCDYGAHVKYDAQDLERDMMKLRASLAAVNWAMRALGVPPELRQAMMEVQRAVYVFNVCRMLAQGSGAMSAIRMGLSAVGLGQVTGGVRALRAVSNVVGVNPVKTISDLCNGD